MMLNKFILCLLSILFYSHPILYAEPYLTVEDKAALPILTPSFSNRQVAKIKLANGLEAYIISDPKAIKSAAALAVNVGSWSDPIDAPGIAHFLEHMLFLGTEKYPIESEYDRFVKENNGESNAYTASDHTLYLFAVNNNAFKETLDRFSYFFKKPLFNPSGVSRELQAINQEFAKNFSEDSVREMYVHKEASNPNHPFFRFSSGNIATLSKVSQQTLQQWYRDHYSANLMHLIIYSPLPLSELKQLVEEDFKDIPNTNKAPTISTVPLFPNTRYGQIFYVEPLKNIRALRLMWELPAEFAQMQDTKPGHLICYILGHEGPGSLFEELKKENLADGIECSGYYLGTNHYIMSLYIKLTEQGLQEVNTVIEQTFGAINGLKSQGIPSYFFDEVKKIETLRYQYQSREDPFDYLMEMGEWLIREKLETFPEQTLVIQKFDPQAIKDLLNYMTPEHTAITILAKSEVSGIKLDRKEKWMGVPYTVRPISTELLDTWSKAQPDNYWHLPDPNPFIPQNTPISFSKDSKEKHTIPHPETLIDNEEAIIYYAKDLDFQLPQAIWSFEIKTPMIRNQIPAEVAMADLYIKSLKEQLNPYSYNATIADLEYEITRTDNGIGLTLKGYQDNAETLFDAILKQLKSHRPSKETFETLKESLSRRYQNFNQEGPLKQVLEVYQSVLYKYYSTYEQLAEAIQKISYEDFLNFSDHLFDHTYTYGLLYGNVEKDQAIRVWNKLKTTLSSQPYPKKDQQLPEIVVFPQDIGPFSITVPIAFSGNATLLSIEDTLFSFKTRAAQQIISKAMSGPFYAALRTQQQTAYIVYNSAEEIERHLFNFFIVQSNTHEPRDLLARFELFIEQFLQNMDKDELTEEKFEIIRKSLLESLEEPPQSLTEMGKLLKVLAFKYDGDFDWVAKRIQGFKELKYEELLEIASQLLGKSNKRRLAILIEGQIPKEQKFQYTPLKGVQEIRQLSTYTDKPKKE